MGNGNCEWTLVWTGLKFGCLLKKKIMSKPLRHDISKLLEKEGWFVEEKKNFFSDLLHTFSKIVDRYNFCSVNIRIIKLLKK